MRRLLGGRAFTDNNCERQHFQFYFSANMSELEADSQQSPASASSSAHRREARRRKILENAKSRMDKLKNVQRR